MIDWTRVGNLTLRASSIEALMEHRIHLIAARVWRAHDRPLLPELVALEQLAVRNWLVLGVTLRRAREVYDGEIALMKGAEAAMWYPVSTDRPFNDVDLLVDDAPAAQRALLSAGFVEVGEPELYRDIHHLRPLALPEAPIAVELHSSPKWPDGLTPPPARQLLEAARPSALRIDGIDALSAEHHAVCLAAHAWAHEPLARVCDLLDVAAAFERADERETRRFAADWGIGGILRSTLGAAEATVGSRRRSSATQTWARHLDPPRQRTVAGTHLMRWLSPFSATAFAAAVADAAAAVADDVRPSSGERWGRKLQRSARAVANARVPRQDFDAALGDEAQIGNEVWERIQARDSQRRPNAPSRRA